MSKLHTVASILKARGIPRSSNKVRAAVDKLELVPVMRAGQAKLFDDVQRAMIETELDRIADKKAGEK